MDLTVYTARSTYPPLPPSPSLFHPRPCGEVNVSHVTEAERELRGAQGDTRWENRGSAANRAGGRGLGGRCQARNGPGPFPGRCRCQGGSRALRGGAPL